MKKEGSYINKFDMSILRLYSLDIYSEWELIMIEVFEEKEDTSNQEDESQIDSIEKFSKESPCKMCR